MFQRNENNLLYCACSILKYESLIYCLPIKAFLCNNCKVTNIFYQDAETLSAGTENGRPDAYHGAAFVYGDVEIVAHAHRQLGEIG